MKKFIVEIVVRRAKKNEPLTTLDGQNFKLNEKHLLITDGAGPISFGWNNGSKKTLPYLKKLQRYLLRAPILIRPRLE